MLPAYGLYGHIRNNNIKSVIILGGFAFLIGLLWYAGCLYIVADARSRPFHAILQEAARFAQSTCYIPIAIVGVWFCIAYLFHSAIIRAGTGAVAVTRTDEPRLYNVVETLVITAGLPMPAIEIIEVDALNAYASGLSEQQATVAVTRGLLDKLDDRELAAVIAHELTHVKNRDVRLILCAVVFAGMISLIAELMLRVFLGSRSSDDKDSKAGFLALGITIVAFVFSFILQFAMSRSREYLADAGAVELTKDPDALISALRKISSNPEVADMPASFSGMMIAAADGEGGLFSTHPDLESRVDRLIRFAGGKDVPTAVEETDLPKAA